MHKSLKILFIGAVATVSLIVGASAATITAENVNFRMEPSLSSSVIMSLDKGRTVGIVEQTGDWYKATYNGYTGYINKDFIAEYDITYGSYGSGSINGTGVRLRTGPGLDYNILANYDTGTALTADGVSGDWYSVKIGNQTGFVHKDYISFGTAGTKTATATYTISSEAQGTVKNLLETAVSYLGTPYVYGGMSASGFDCSGFVCYVFNQYGYSLGGRSCSAMYNSSVGYYVDKSELQPGDLVFFTSSTESIGHVGIYLGDGDFIHSSSGSAYSVVISSLSADNYSRRYVGAKRIIY